MRRSSNKLTIEQFVEQSAAKRVMVVTGAGVSTLSGIPDFTTIDENWDEPFSREFALSSKFFWAEPARFWTSYQKMFFLKAAEDVKPSAAHLFLKNLESSADVTIFTQNVDGLHQAAGSSKVVEVHGNAGSLTCVECGEQYSSRAFFDKLVPFCPEDEARLKPDVLLYGETTKTFERMFAAISETDLLLVMGTSLNVSPVCNVPVAAKMYCPKISRVYWDKDAHKHADLFTKTISLNFSELQLNG